MIEECIEELAKYIGKDRIKKEAVGLYYIESDLMLIDDDTNLYISLVEGINLYFIDSNRTLKEIELTVQEMEQLEKVINKFNVSLEDGSISMKTSKKTIYQDYNTFATILSYVQMFCILRGKVSHYLF